MQAVQQDLWVNSDMNVLVPTDNLRVATFTMTKRPRNLLLELALPRRRKECCQTTEEEWDHHHYNRSSYYHCTHQLSNTCSDSFEQVYFHFRTNKYSLVGHLYQIRVVDYYSRQSFQQPRCFTPETQDGFKFRQDLLVVVASTTGLLLLVQSRL